MTDVRLAAETLYAGRIAAHDSDVVQHGSLFNEPSVKFQLRMLTGDGESLVGYGAAVDKEDVAQSIVFGIIFVYDCLIIHCLLLYRWSRGGRHPWEHYTFLLSRLQLPCDYKKSAAIRPKPMYLWTLPFLTVPLSFLPAAVPLFYICCLAVSFHQKSHDSSPCRHSPT